MEPAVLLDGITKRFPGVVANDDVTLRVEPGSVHALLGENGAGKTTLMNVLYGLYRPEAGSIAIEGSPQRFDSPREAIDAGVGMIHQHFMLVDPMTVTENVTLGREPRKWGGLAIDRARARREVDRLADSFGFDVDPTARIESLSVGAQQRVEILKALYRGADILILDEPTAVLTPQEVDELFAVFEELTADGKTIIFISHKLGEARRAADEITVLRAGENVGTVSAGSTSRERLAEMMVGRQVVLDVEKPQATAGAPILSVDSLVVADDRGVPAVDGVGFGVRSGEVFGIAGVDGNGQSELVEAITGLREVASGEVTLGGQRATSWSRARRIQAGLAYIPEDRQIRGLVLDFDLAENGILGSQHRRPFARLGRLDRGAAQRHAGQLIDRYDVRPADAGARARALSGGNQQKLIVGREMAREPRLLVASHPTRGVDIGSVEFIHERVLQLRSKGVGVLLVSSKLEEVLGLSDRLAVMHDGQLMAVVDPASITEREVGLLMGGEIPPDLELAASRLSDAVGGVV
jgi:simple sugar transport system ATP-binding protein